MTIDDWFTDYMDLVKANFMSNTIEAGIDKDLTELWFELLMKYPVDYMSIVLEVLRLFQEDPMLKEKMDERIKMLPEFFDQDLIEEIGVE